MSRQREIDGRAKFTERTAVEAQAATKRAVTPPPAAAAPARTPVRLAWHTGDKVLWNGYVGTFLREMVDDHAEVLIGTRTYRVRKAELQST